MNLFGGLLDPLGIGASQAAYNRARQQRLNDELSMRLQSLRVQSNYAASHALSHQLGLSSQAMSPQQYRDQLANVAKAMVQLTQRPPTEQEVAEKELRDFLGEDLWSMKWLTS